ncbi:MAG: hypothetical protein H6622_00080 [Halobacteriovoraceae bacterium]|nr:hypothetical protein [Halobacteriovoraceae bacterium]
MKGIDLLKVIGPEAIGLIWITQDYLINVPEGLLQIDYLLDGQLIDYLNNKDKVNRDYKKNLFIGEQFGNPFFLGHVREENNSVASDVFEILDVTKSFHLKDKIIFTYGLEKDILNRCNQKYSDYTFKSI